jgi:thiol:disulfide interchange protein
MKLLRGLLLLVGGLLVAAPVLAQATKSDSVVKAKVTADKPVGGKQVVTITLEIDPKYHLYANPVGNPDFEASQVKVDVSSARKLESVKIDYPPGKLKKDATAGDYKEYKGKVTIKANVQRAKDDTGPLTVSIKIQACDDSKCLFPSTIKKTVE